MTDKEAMKLALEALELLTGAWQTFDALDYGDKAITALKEAMADPMREVQRLGQEIEQEPVAWGVFEGNLHDMFFTQSEAQEMAKLKGTHAEVRPFYTTPQPQRTWVGLTDEEISELIRATHNTGSFVCAIEAKLKEKNT
jgi:hypothetical protein